LFRNSPQKMGLFQRSDGVKGHEAIQKELMEHCRENLAPYKVPKVIEITEAIPLTAVGKVDKKALRVKVPAHPIQ